MGLAGKRAGRAVAPIAAASWVTEITPPGGANEPLHLVARVQAGNAARHDAPGPLESAKRRVARTAPLSSASAQPVSPFDARRRA